MLKLKKRIRFWLLICLAFSMVIFAAPAQANQVTIDLGGMGASVEDIANRELTVWKVSDRVLAKDGWQALVKELEAKDTAALNAAYQSFTYTTDASGQVRQDFAKGSYYVRVTEKKGSVNIYPFLFVSDKAQKVYPKSHHDTPPGNVELLKISNDKVPLAGAVFKLYRLDGGELITIKSSGNSSEFVTDADGKIYREKLLAGDYLFEEIRAPEHYRIKNAKTYFTVVDGRTTRVEVVNYKDEEGGKRFKKVSSDKKKPLAGAKFVVTKKTADGYERIKQNGKDLILESGEDGYFMADNLPYGTYFLWETQAPQGYATLSGAISFVVDGQSLEKDLVIENKPVETVPPKTTPPGSPTKPPSSWTPSKHVVIPRTGDISLLLLALAGCMSALAGRRLIRDNKKR